MSKFLRLSNLIKWILSLLYSKANQIKGHLHWYYIWLQTLPPFQGKPGNLKVYNSYFDSRELPQLSYEIKQMIHSDRYLWYRLADETIQGIRAWEYGKLLHYFSSNFTNMQILDIGSGASTFPAFLASKGAMVKTFDYPSPLEKMKSSHFRRMQKLGITLTQGTMLRLPYCNECFDLVTCISTIEHLDVSPPNLKANKL